MKRQISLLLFFLALIMLDLSVESSEFKGAANPGEYFDSDTLSSQGDFDDEDSDQEEIGLPLILPVSHNQDDWRDLSRFGDLRVGDLGGGAVIDVDSNLGAGLVDSDDSNNFNDSDVFDRRVREQMGNRLGDWRKEADETLSFLDLNQYGDYSQDEESLEENMLSGHNELSPESPYAIVDQRTALLAAATFKQRMLDTGKGNIEPLIQRVNRLEMMLQENIISLSWFTRALENLKIDFDATDVSLVAR